MTDWAPRTFLLGIVGVAVAVVGVVIPALNQRADHTVSRPVIRLVEPAPGQQPASASSAAATEISVPAASNVASYSWPGYVGPVWVEVDELPRSSAGDITVTATWGAKHLEKVISPRDGPVFLTTQKHGPDGTAMTVTTQPGAGIRFGRAEHGKGQSLDVDDDWTE